MSGELHLLPVGLGPSPTQLTHPPAVLAQIDRIEHFIVERAKTARAELKRLGFSRPIQEALIAEIPEKPKTSDLDQLLAPALAGHMVGLMSEAGCPAVADPGALVVRRAHEQGIRVVPHVGPSSLLLALMASGLNGQSFAFHGYLPQKNDERDQAIRSLERESAKQQRTQIFIETPYRNTAMMAALTANCQPSTLICVARSLTTPSEWVATRSAAQWKKSVAPELDRQPTVFLILASAA